MRIRGIQKHLHKKVLTRFGVLIIAAGAVLGPIYSVQSSSSLGVASRTKASKQADRSHPAVAAASTSFTGVMNLLSPLPAGEGIVTYESTCTTPTDSFNLGDTVCAIVSGAPLGGSRPARRIAWVSPYGSLTQGSTITSDPQTFFYQIPANATQTFTDVGGGTVIVDNRGVWKVATQSNLDGSAAFKGVSFTVHDPQKAFVDLAVSQDPTSAESNVSAGSGSVFKIFVSNRGPDTAQDVLLTDTIPSNATFSSVVENTSIGFTCGAPSGGTFTCTASSLAPGDQALLTFAYDADNSAAAGSAITNVVTVSSSNTPCGGDPCELAADDNTSTASASVPTGVSGETCTLICHENFSVVANATQGGNPGAFVNFGAASPFGNCGAITANPASGSFFPVGTTVVSVTSDTGGGSCSFTISVVQGTPPSIVCPPDKTATDDGSGSHTFTAQEIGTPSTTPAGLPVTFVRSDDIPATYDDNGNILTPAVVHSLTDPFLVGTTGITWTATDANGLTASCTQTVIVHPPCASDSQPPTITAPPDITTSTGANSTTCGVVIESDQLGQAVAQDDCSATVTVSGIPAGNLFPIGTTTITYTATDGGGRTATATQHVTVTDNTPPVIFAPANASYTCPEQVPVLSPSQAFGPNIIVNGQEVPGPVFDNCGNPTVTASQTTNGVGSAANPLVITRTYTAVDTHGNSSSAVQIITVTDSTPPSIIAPADVIAYTGAGATTCDAVVNVGTATASDNCAGVTVSRSPSGNTFSVGTTTVTWTATDWAGNTATATQNVTVIDNTPPVITVISSTPSLWPPNHKYQTFQVTNFVTSVFDNCGGVGVGDVTIQKVTSDEAENGAGSGDTLNDIVISSDCKSVQLRAEREGGGDGRVYTITFKVTDTHGNVGTATSKVVVPHNPGETPVDSGVHYTVNGTCP
jgi:uncharacterized repeat protein (TIGR01451 family)